MADWLLSSEPSYAEKLDSTPGEFHEIRIVMEKMWSLVKPHPELGFWDEIINELFRKLKWENSYKIARILLRGSQDLAAAA